MSDKLEVPRLKVKRDWHVGLNPDPVDRSHPDVHDDQLIQEALLNSRPRKFLFDLSERSMYFSILSSYLNLVVLFWHL